MDQNFDSYSAEYTFPDGSKLICNGRCMANVENIYKSYALGTKGMAIVSSAGDCGQRIQHLTVAFNPDGRIASGSPNVPRDETNPYQNEWNDLVDAIRNDKPL